MPKRAAPEPPTFTTEVSNGHAWTPYTDRVDIKWTNPQNNGEDVKQFKIDYVKVRQLEFCGKAFEAEAPVSEL
jgi:hypothetical protein